MNVLFVTYHYLHGNGGGVFASRAYINAFSEIAESMSLIYPMKDGMDIEGVSDIIKLYPVYNNKSIIFKILDLVRGRVHRYFCCFEEILIKGKYTVVVFDNSTCSYRLIDIAHRYGCKVITIHHNYQVEYTRDNSSKLTKFLNVYWTKSFEKDAVLKSDLNLTLTSSDISLLKEHYAKNVNVKIKLLGCFEYSKSNRNIKEFNDGINMNRFIITGNLGAKQTEDSLIPWLYDYYPLLKKIIPNASLTLAGKNPSETLINLCKSLNIRVIPSPKDMQPFLKEADYYICPTALGGGLKLRVMDGLKSGLIVICHQVSSRGYEEFINKNYLLVYDDVSSFKQCLEELFTIDYSKEKLRDIYNSLFSFEKGVERLKLLLNKSL